MDADRTRVIPLAWTGPLPLTQLSAPDSPSDTHAAGVYVWTARVDGEWWAYYIGLTGKTFAERHREHLHLYREGRYRIYEPGAFARGHKVLAWGGAFGPHAPDILIEFRRRTDLAATVPAFLALLHVFLIPTNAAPRPTERLEAALASILKRAPGGAAWFQDEDVRYAPCHPADEPLTFTLQPLPIVGLTGRNVLRLPLGIVQEAE